MNSSPNKSQLQDKSFLLDYFRNIAESSQESIKKNYGESNYKDRANEFNKILKEGKESLNKLIGQKSKTEEWTRDETIDVILMSTYTSYVVMIDFRNQMWPYDYMTFSRRIGELWEPFCALSWEYPVNPNISFISPPNFAEVKLKLRNEIREFSESLGMKTSEKARLESFYEKVWSIVDSGEIKLDLDLHFTDSKKIYNIDFKSGFSSNEKGNTNRLLLVASIYKMIGEHNECEIYVRAEEESNNHYLQTLKNSNSWKVFCGAESYDRMREHTGFGMKNWIETNISWEDDLLQNTVTHLREKNLNGYLKW